MNNLKLILLTAITFGILPTSTSVFAGGGSGGYKICAHCIGVDYPNGDVEYGTGQPLEVDKFNLRRDLVVQVPINRTERQYDGVTFNMRYYLYVPNIPTNGSKLKLMVAIHGSPALCTDNLSSYASFDPGVALGRARSYLWNSLERRPSSQYLDTPAAKNNYAILAPAFCGGYANTENTTALNELLDSIQSSYPYIDASKVVIWGQSQGGEYVQTFVKDFHERILRAAPVGSGIYYDAARWSSSVVENTNVKFAVGATDCRCNPYTVDIDGTTLNRCFNVGDDGLTGPPQPTTEITWNDKCYQGSRYDNKWRRQKRLQMYVCCDLAKSCDVSTSQLTPSIPGAEDNPDIVDDPTKFWHPKGASFSCEQYYNPEFPNFDSDFTCQKPEPSQNKCDNISVTYVANKFGVQGHDGLSNYLAVQDYLIKGTPIFQETIPKVDKDTLKKLISTF